MLRLIALERPPVFHAVVWSYDLFLYSTPFLACSMIFSLLYVHLYRSEQELAAGSLPPYPDPHTRTELSLVLGEVHRQLVPKPSPAPQWLSIPERGLYTGIASFGSIGVGKTYGLILPAMRQLFAYRADDPERKLSGIVLEVKGDLCRQLQRILKWCGRERDYVEVSLDGDIRYNPLNNSLDAYAQAFNIASIITSIWGKGKEPFWQQSYTDLVRYVILLHRIRDGYLTMVDLFRTVISAGKLEEMLTEVGSRFSTTSYIGIGKEAYREYEALLSPLGFEWNKDAGLYLIAWTEALENLLTQETSAEPSMSSPASRTARNSATASTASSIGIGNTGSSFAPRSRPPSSRASSSSSRSSRPIPMCAASSARRRNSTTASHAPPILAGASCRPSTN